MRAASSTLSRAGPGPAALGLGIFVLFSVPLVASLFFKENWLWMDEVLSYLLVTDPSSAHMNAAIVSGMDANPPLFSNVYWLVAKVISSNIYFLRACSTLLFAGALALFYRYVTKLIDAPLVNFILLTALASTTYLNLTLATQIRSYALFLAISLGFFITAHRLLLAPSSRLALLAHLGTGVMLVFAHNFGLFYLAGSGALFLLLFVGTRGKFPLLPLLVHALVVYVWFIAWGPSFVIQARSGDPHSWIPLPTLWSFFDTVGELAPSLSSRLERTPAFAFLPVLRFAVVVGLFAYLATKKLRQGWEAVRQDPAFLFYLLAGFLYLVTIAMALAVSLVHTSVFLSRYLWPSQMLVMFQLVYAFHHFFRPRIAVPVAALAAYGLALGAFVFIQNRKLVVFPRDILPELHALGPGPVFVESADYFLPLWHHLPSRQVHYVFDWESASRAGNLPSATVENRILDGVREHYGLPGLELLSRFTPANFSRFYVIDEASIFQFERFVATGRVKVIGELPTSVPGHRILECAF